MDKLSIVVPIYNMEKYLKKCVDSILAQTYANLEIILVDDGSTDSCGEICDEYAEKDGRIRVIHKENGGLSDARNAGIEAATGEYMGFVDSDDYIVRDMYMALHDALVRNSASIAVCGYEKIYPNKQAKKITVEEEFCASGKEILNKRLLNEWEFWVIACNKLYKRYLFDSVRYPKSKRNEDSFVVHELFFKADRIVCIKDICYCYIQTPGSIIRQDYSIKNLDDLEAFILRTEFYLDNNLSEWMIIKNLDYCHFELHEAYDKGDIKKGAFRSRLKEILALYRTMTKKTKCLNIPMKKRLIIWLLCTSPNLEYFAYRCKRLCKRLKQTVELQRKTER